MIGRTLATYRVLSKLGAGGMGEVYRARDEKLDRDVAIKVLPTHLLGDERARSRFRKEANALSRLTHPHVATLLDFGSTDGADYLVMELIPGLTLGEMLLKGPLPAKDVVRLGTQLARGLKAAHEQGIVHRDLKPSNLCLTGDGLLKILDFGLAHLAPTRSQMEETPTETAAGKVVGSPPYMSPEQLLGKDVDARSDVYSAGACLYELATGKKPYGDRSGAALVDAILHEAPEPASQAKAEVPAGLRSVIAKAMDKDAGLRYQTAAELLVDLERLQQGSEAGGSVGPSAGWRWRSSGRRAVRRGAIAGTAVSLVGLVVFVTRLPEAPRVTSARALGIHIGGDLPWYAGVVSWATDGQRLYFVTAKEKDEAGLFQASVNGGESAAILVPFSYHMQIYDYLPLESALLMGGATAHLPEHDPDAATGDGPPVWVVPVPAGAARRLGVNAYYGAASPEGDRLALVQRQKILIARLDGSPLLTLDVGTPVGHVVWNPDGRRVRYEALDPTTHDWRVWERDVAAAGAKPRALRAGAQLGRWTPDGAHYVFSQDNTQDRRNDVYVMSEPRFPWSSRPTPRQLTSGPIDLWSVGPSADGKRLFAIGAVRRAELLRYDRQRRLFEPFLGGPAGEFVDVSPDGSWLAWSSIPEHALWKSRADGTGRQRLSPPGWWVILLRWSPDGRRLSFVATHEGKIRSLYQMAAEGGEPELLVPQPGNRGLWDNCWLSDGHTVVYSSPDTSSPGLFQVDVRTRAVSPFPGGERFNYPKCSRGGDVLASQQPSDSSDHVEWLFDASSRAWRRLGPSPLSWQTWTRDGRSFVGLNVQTNRIERRSIATGRLEPVADLGGIPLIMDIGIPWAGLAPDDSPLVSRDLSTRDIYALDWAAP